MRFLVLSALLVFATSAAQAKAARLQATKETVQWGWLDPKEPPKLTVDSGDLVSIETWYHALDQIQPGLTMEKIVELRKANPGGGPHSLTGPVFVNRAEPGDVLEIRIQRITPRRTASTSTCPARSSPPSARCRRTSPRASSSSSRWTGSARRPSSSPASPST